MRIYIPQLGKRIVGILFLVFFFTGLQAARDENTSYGSDDFPQQITLFEAIQQIAQHYQVLFNYDREIIPDIKVRYEPNANTTVDEAISEVLENTQLKYHIFNYKYVVIYKDDERGIESLKEMIKHFQKIVSEKDEIVAAKKGVHSVARLNTYFPKNIWQSKKLVFSVEGTVTDQDGEPLIGVNIQVKESSKGTATDFDGYFILEDIAENAVLVVSYVGYQTREVVVAGMSNLEIVLQSDSQLLDEVVVVGYGTQTKKNIVGAVSHLKLGDLETRPFGDVSKSLQGTIPGLNIKTSNGGDPSQSMTVNIRGFNSINGGSPLVLVDGVEENLSNINPNDIESISILKDAEAAAIYGARGAFGVILINTKKGRSGNFDITYTNNFSWTTNTTRSDFVSDPYVYGKTVDEAIKSYNGGNYSGFNDGDWDIIQRVVGGEIEPYHEQQSDGSYKFYYNTDFYDVLYRKWRPAQLHNISVSGGSDKLSVYLSGRINNGLKIQKLQDAQINRYNLNLNLSLKPYDWLEIHGGSRLGKIYDEEFGGTADGWGDPFSASMYRDMYPWYPVEIDGVGVDVGRTGTGGLARVAAQMDGKNYRKRNYENNMNSIGAKITPIDNLEINFNYNYKIDRQDNTFRYTPFEYLSSKSLKLATGGLNRLGEWRYRDQYSAINIYGSYQKNFNKKHNFNIMLGFNQEEFHRNRVIAQMEELLSKSVSNLALGTEMYNIDGNTLDWGLTGYFGRLNYNFKEKYLFEINTRYDGSSRFPATSQWGLFPSAAVAWRLDQERFWDFFEPVIQSMKIRASYGELGNQTIDPNTFRQLLGLGKTEWLDGSGNPLYYASIPAPLPETIGWERVNSFNIGFDIGLLKNKLFTTLELYERNTQDMYLPGEPLPAVFGASEPKRSYASLQNKGFELSVRYQNSFNIKGHPLNFDIGGNISNFKGIITKIDNPSNLLSSLREGQHLGEIWGYRIAGQFQSDEEAAKFQEGYNFSKDLASVYRSVSVTSNKEWNYLRAGDIIYRDLNGDGQVNDGANTLEDHGDLDLIGNAMPKFPFGFNFDFEYRGISLSVIGQGIGRQDWYPMGPLYWGLYSRPYVSFLRKDLLENAWSPDNPSGKYPQINRPYYAYNEGREAFNFNDYYLENLGYLRIKNITLGYSIPKNWLQNFFIKDLSIFISSENMLTWSFGGLTKYLDPEVMGSDISYSNPNSASPRSDPDLEYYPMGKSYLFGFKIKF